MNPQDTPGAARDSSAVPVWMRRGTVWTILVLATTFFALIAYYLLPLWWARLVSSWVGSTNAWTVGLVLGFTLIAVGLMAFRLTRRLGVRHRDGTQVRFVDHLRPLLGLITALCVVTTALTVFIAAGITEPLREARALWQAHAPGLMAATLVGALLAVIAVLISAVITARAGARSLDSEVVHSGDAGIPEPELESQFEPELESQLEPEPELELDPPQRGEDLERPGAVEPSRREPQPGEEPTSDQ